MAYKIQRNPDMFILVDDFDAIKVWAEQIECALGSLVPKVTTARKGARHLYLTKHYTTCKKLLFLLDTKSNIYRSHIVDTWLKHFSGLKPKDILCVLVDSGKTDLTDTVLGKERFNVVKTNDIAHFYNWWPTMVEFLFLQTKAAPKVLNYSLETLRTHEDDQLPRRLTQCFDAFIDPDRTRANAKCQTVKVFGGAGEESPQEQENMHIVLASFGVDMAVYDNCNSVHSRAEVLRCVLFVLIDAGVVKIKRFTRTETARQFLRNKRLAVGHLKETLTPTKLIRFFLAVLYFIINLPAAVMLFCVSFIPVFGVILVRAYVYDAKKNFHKTLGLNLGLLCAFHMTAFVIILVYFVTIPNVPVLEICLYYAITTIYVIGWMICINYYCFGFYNCKYGIWSLPSKQWSTTVRLPKLLKMFYLPIIITHFILLLLVAFPFGVIALITECYENRTKALISRTKYGSFFSIYVLGSEATLVIVLILILTEMQPLTTWLICVCVFCYFMLFNLFGETKANESDEENAKYNCLGSDDDCIL